jgi:hypothetical protein
MASLLQTRHRKEEVSMQRTLLVIALVALPALALAGGIGTKSQRMGNAVLVLNPATNQHVYLAKPKGFDSLMKSLSIKPGEPTSAAALRKLGVGRNPSTKANLENMARSLEQNLKDVNDPFSQNNSF